MNIKQQTSKNQVWRDEKGMDVPYKFVPQIDRMKEKSAFQLATTAYKISSQLMAFKTLIEQCCSEVFGQQLSKKEIEKSKGNYTWYNFEGSIKIVVNVNDRIEFDSILIEKCRQKLIELVTSGISKDKVFLEKLIQSAFETTKGQLDTKKILTLRKYSSSIEDKRYQEAMKYLDEAIRRPDSKKYYQVFLRNEQGGYDNIPLNFSSM